MTAVYTPLGNAINSPAKEEPQSGRKADNSLSRKPTILPDAQR
jgi:hypothetical protein